MKIRYRKIFGFNLYIKEIKKHWWSSWKVHDNGIFPIAYDYINGNFVQIAGSCY